MASPGLVILDYADLIGGTTSDALKGKIKEAYGYDGLGILAIRGIPHFARLRQAFLPLSWKLGQLPQETLAKYEHPASYWQFGWSRGKEKLEGGRPDFSKGSFYANPVYDRPSVDSKLVEAFPAFYNGNIWPTDEDAPGFEAAYKALARLVVDVGTQLAVHCDAFVQSELPAYPSGKLHRILSTSRTGKARALHYFPYEQDTAGGASGTGEAGSLESSWCGWHNDHGSLTGLTPAMFHAADGSEIPCPDPASGLYIKSRTGEVVRVVIPSDHLAFQIGETSQVHSGGILRATPHCVRAAAIPGVSRSTLAVFLEPEWDESMDSPEGGDVLGARGSGTELLPRSVPSLASRWRPEQNFAAFTEATLAAYH